MSLCAACGVPLSGDTELCPHHSVVFGDDKWAEGNRAFCAFIHRGHALPSPKRDDDPWLEILRTAPWNEV